MLYTVILPENGKVTFAAFLFDLLVTFIEKKYESKESEKVEMFR
jgi:hypothetical protein